jgi:hypothetical protein
MFAYANAALFILNTELQRYIYVYLFFILMLYSIFLNRSEYQYDVNVTFLCYVTTFQ